MRYTPYDVPTGVLSPPPDYGKGQSHFSETDSWSGCFYSCILRINSFLADFKPIIIFCNLSAQACYTL